jgi:hypothetical protein
MWQRSVKISRHKTVWHKNDFALQFIPTTFGPFLFAKKKSEFFLRFSYSIQLPIFPVPRFLQKQKFIFWPFLIIVVGKFFKHNIRLFFLIFGGKYTFLKENIMSSNSTWIWKKQIYKILYVHLYWVGFIRQSKL